MVAAAVVGGAVIGGGSSLISSGKQAKAISESSKASVAEQRHQFDTMLQLTEPRRNAENAAVNQLRNVLGIGDVSGVDYSQFYNTPGYEFARNEAMRAVDRNAAASGGRLSGNTLTALQDRASGLASQNYLSTYLAPLQNLALGNAGQAAGQGALNLGVNVGNTLTNAGANRASAIGQGYQGLNNSIQGGLSNYLFMNQVQPKLAFSPSYDNSIYGG